MPVYTRFEITREALLKTWVRGSVGRLRPLHPRQREAALIGGGEVSDLPEPFRDCSVTAGGLGEAPARCGRRRHGRTVCRLVRSSTAVQSARCGGGNDGRI